MQGSQKGKRAKLWGPRAHIRANISMKIALKYALKLIFFKCIFEFMINTAPQASNNVYGREKLF